MPPLRVDLKRRTTLPKRGDNRGYIVKRKKRRMDNKRDYGDGSIGGATNKKNKRKRVSE